MTSLTSLDWVSAEDRLEGARALPVEAERPRVRSATLCPHVEACDSLPCGLHLCHRAGTPSFLPLQRSAQASLAEDQCRHGGPRALTHAVMSDSV